MHITIITNYFTIFSFMWQICGHIPQTLIAQQDVTCMAAKLSVSFFIETFIHAKEKVSILLITTNKEQQVIKMSNVLNL